jgi:hypothetical protein
MVSGMGGIDVEVGVWFLPTGRLLIIRRVKPGIKKCHLSVV